MSRAAIEHELAQAALAEVRPRTRDPRDEDDEPIERPRKALKLTESQVAKIEVDVGELRLDDHSKQACKLTATELEDMRRRDRELAAARRRREDDNADVADVVENTLRTWRRGKEPTPFELMKLAEIRGAK